MPTPGPLAITVEAYAYATAPTHPVVRFALKTLPRPLRGAEEGGRLGWLLGPSPVMEPVPQPLQVGLAAPPSSVTLELPRAAVGQRVAYAVWGWPVLTGPQSLPIRPTADSTLLLAAGLRGAGGDLDVPPVVMTARLLDAAGRRVADPWRVTLDSEAGATRRGWRDQRIDLSRWAGQTLTLQLETQGEAAGPWGVWARPLVRRPLAHRRTSVVLLSLDTLRADHIGAYGYQRATTPVLDRLAATSFVFTRAFAPFPSTTASHMSMLTARLPCNHGVVTPRQRLRQAIPTIAEVFADARFATAAITENGLIAGPAGFRRGFERYRELRQGSRKLGTFGEVTRRAAAVLDDLEDAPFFLFLHTYQVHTPYKFPADLAETFTVDGDAPKAEREKADYDRGLRYADELLDDLLVVIERARERGPVALVVTSDHGTEFGEHGRIGHALGVHVEQLHVPLLINHPPLGAGGRIDHLAELIDLPRTLLALADVDPPDGLGGRNLLQLVAGTAAGPRQAFGEQLWGPRTTSLRTGEFTWIHDAEGTRVYDPRADPLEQRDLSSERPALAARGREAIEAFRRRCTPGRPMPDGPAVPLDPERAKALRSLGYIE
jgi:arylsulfatase A-like enzyme